MTDELEGAGERIRGQVAEVVSDRELILNRGSTHGVKAGDYFAILDPDTVGVTDPETDEALGDIRVVKIVVQAVEIAPRLTLARTFRTQTVNVGGTGAAIGIGSLASMFTPPEYVEEVETFVLDRNAPRKVDPKESVVRRGDPFESASPEEVEDRRSVTTWQPK